MKDIYLFDWKYIFLGSLILISVFMTVLGLVLDLF